MTIQTRILFDSWLTLPEPENDNFDRLTVAHEATRSVIADLITRGELERYRKPGDVIMETTPDGNMFTMTWSSRAVAQEWLDYCATGSGYISGEIIET